MSKAHQAERIVLVFRLVYVFADLADITDLFEHRENGFVSTTVCRSPERRYARSDRGVRVCARAACHAHGRCRAILLMIRVQNEQEVDCFGRDFINHIRLGRNCEEHLQQVFAIVEIVARIHERLAAVQFIGGGCDRR